MRSPVEAFDSGSNYSFGDKMEHPSFPRSAFNLGHLISTTIDNCGQVQVLDVIETLPGDDHEINIKSLIRCLPQVVPLYSRQRIYIYAFWNRYSDLWNNFNTFMTKGYDGNTIKTVPGYNAYNTVHPDIGEPDMLVKPGSLADGFGIQQGVDVKKLNDINCFDAMQYLRIWRDYFMNKNFFINDRVVLPDDDSRFRLDDDGQLLSAKDNNVYLRFNISDDSWDGYQVDEDTGNRTFTLFCHDWQQDYFTSGLPWPQRGAYANMFQNVSGLLPIALDTKGDGTQINNLFYATGDASGLNHYYPKSIIAEHAGVGGVDLNLFPSKPDSTFSANGSFTKVEENGAIPQSLDITNKVKRGLYVNLGDSILNFGLQQLRELAVNQKELEVMARTDGSYAEFGLSFFKEKSKNAVDFKPVYIGGCYENIQYNEVLQTSAQYAESSGEYVPVGSPLGTYAGHGIGSANGYIGRLHCDDYGQIMILCCIMPDVYYSTGIERRLTNKYQSDFFLPERAKLGLRPTLKKEIFFSGVQADDDDLFNYQNIFDEYRYLPNRIKGKIADSNSLNFFPYTQSRVITQTPEFNEGFCEANNIRKDYLQADSEVAFTAQFKIEDRCVRALPYKGIPADILN